MDLGSPERVVAALYDLISGPGGDRDWAAVRDLFLPDAVLQSELLLPDGARQSGRWTVDAFIGEASADYARLGGFWEREVWSRVDRYGDIAQVWSTYESRVGTPGAPPAVRGINAIQLLRRDDRWWIAGLLFQIERPPIAPIPGHYLGAG